MYHNYFRIIYKDIWNIFKSSYFGIFLAVIFTSISIMSLSFIDGSVQSDREKAENLSALRLIEVTAYTPNSSLPIDDQTLEIIRETPGVSHVYPWYQETLELADSESWPSENNPGGIPATPWIPELAPAIVAGEVSEAGPGRGEIVLPHSVLGGTTDRLVGHEILVAIQREIAPGQGEFVDMPMKVIATADNSVVGMAGMQPSYVSYDTLKGLSASGAPKNYSIAYVRTEEASQIISIQNDLGQKGFGVTSLSDKIPTLYGLLKVLQYLSYFLLFLALATVLMMGFLLGGSWIRRKSKDLALLKMLGYNRKDIFTLVVGELSIFGLLLSCCTVVLSWITSFALSSYLVAQGENFLGLTQVVVPSWQLTLLIFILYPLGLALAGSLPAMKVARLSMDRIFRDL